MHITSHGNSEDCLLIKCTSIFTQLLRFTNLTFSWRHHVLISFLVLSEGVGLRTPLISLVHSKFFFFFYGQIWLRVEFPSNRQITLHNIHLLFSYRSASSRQGLLCVQRKTVAITSIADEIVFGFFGAFSPRAVHRFNCCFDFGGYPVQSLPAPPRVS